MTGCPLGLSGRCYCANQLNSFGTPEQSSAISANTAVLLLAHGSPENPDQIPEFLSYVTGGRALPATVIEEIRHRYSLIGFSPLACWTRFQADQLSQLLKLPVFIGMRNWKPFIADAVKAISSQRYDRVIVLCLAPQNSRTSVGLYRRAVVGDGTIPFEIDFVEQWHDHPLLIKAFAENLRSSWEKASAENGAKLLVIFTAHSVPQRTITGGDLYEMQSRETGALVAKEAGLQDDEWTFAFQSQGMSGGPWIGPTVEETIASLKAKRPSRRLRATSRISVRSRRSALRYRHRIQTVRGKRKHAPLASRVLERLRNINDSLGADSKKPNASVGHLAKSLASKANC